MITVIVPVYNSEKTVKRCVESIMGQSEQELEILLINDGSTDKSQKICESLAEQDKRIRLINKKNAGVSAARNTGILYARGEYLQFVDSDDYIELDMCKTLLESIEQHKADISICGFHHWYDGADVVKVPEFINSKVLDKGGFAERFLELYQHGFLNMPWNKLYRKDLVSDYFEEDLSLGEDLLFNLSYLESVTSIGVVKEPLYHYIQERGVESLSSQKREDKLEIAQHICKVTEEFYHETLGKQGQEEKIYARMVAEFLCDIAESVFQKQFSRNQFKELTKKCFENQYLSKINHGIYDLPLDLKVLNFFFVRNQSGMLWLLCQMRKVLIKLRYGVNRSKV